MSLSCPTWIGRRPRPCVCFFRTPAEWLCLELLSPVFSPSPASLGATKRPYGHARYDILGIVLPRLVVPFLPFVVLCFPCNSSAEVPDRVMCTYTCDYPSPARLDESLGSTAPGLIVSPLGLFHCTACSSRRTFRCAFPYQMSSKPFSYLIFASPALEHPASLPRLIYDTLKKIGLSYRHWL